MRIEHDLDYEWLRCARWSTRLEALLEVEADVCVAERRGDHQLPDVWILASTARGRSAMSNTQNLHAVLLITRGNEIHWVIAIAGVFDDGMHSWLSQRRPGIGANDDIGRQAPRPACGQA